MIATTVGKNLYLVEKVLLGMFSFVALILSDIVEFWTNCPGYFLYMLSSEMRQKSLDQCLLSLK